jgi:hypothetical protein
VTAKNFAETLVNMALEFPNTYAFGGYVRDKVILEKRFHDIDLMFDDASSARSYINIVKQVFKTEVEELCMQNYGSHTHLATLNVHFKARTIKMDIVVKTSEETNVDFTCNNLAMYKNHKLVPINNMDMSSDEMFLICMKDILNKRLRFIGNVEQPRRLFDRRMKMHNRGFKPIDNCVCSVNLPRKKTTEECPICYDNLEGTRWITTVCGHKFHESCMKKYVDTNNHAKCPMCRENHFVVKPNTLK